MAGWIDRDGVAAVGALAGPALVAAALVPLRDEVDTTNAALVMVVVVVAVAASGRRWAGTLAAASATLSFDYFLTQPYHRLMISNRDDVETAVLLLLVGLAVSELAAWGRRRQAEVVRRDAGVAGIDEAVKAMSADSLAQPRVEVASALLARLLGVRCTGYRTGSALEDARATTESAGPEPALLRTDGQVEVEGAFCDVEHFGLPTNREIELGVVDGLGQPCRFVLQAQRDTRPSTAQRLAAVAVAAWAVQTPIVFASTRDDRPD